MHDPFNETMNWNFLQVLHLYRGVVSSFVVGLKPENNTSELLQRNGGVCLGYKYRFATEREDDAHRTQVEK